MAQAPLGRAVVSGLPPAGTAATVLVDGAAGRIEALVAVPAGQPVGLALVCHPHPLHGGALGNKVTYTVASAALKHGMVAVRFNFRGVGKSAGTHDGGRGETEDTVAMAQWLRGLAPGLDLLLAGFSFGAFVSLKAAAAVRPALQISIAPPFKYFASEPLPPRPECPWLVVHAHDDGVVPFAETRDALARYRPPPILAELATAGHFFHGQLGEVQALCTGFIGDHWPA